LYNFTSVFIEVTKTMSDTLNSPYLAATLVTQPGRHPGWSTYPVEGLYLDLGTQSIYQAEFGDDGVPFPTGSNPPIGNRGHSGSVFYHDKRSDFYRPSTVMANRQAVSLITIEEIGHIVGLLGIDPADSLDALERHGLAEADLIERVADDDAAATNLVVAHCLGANMVVGGLAPGQRLQTGYDVGRLGEGADPDTGAPRPEFRGSVGITGINQPCRHPGGMLAKVYGLDNPKAKADLFKTGARGNRGHVAQIIEEGVLRTGDPLLIAPYRS
jgi:hypothetical protein